MSTALEKLFVESRAAHRAILIGYMPAGFPTQAGCISIIEAMIEGGVDAIEIGFPYSDPVMDGPVIQAASEQSLRQGTSSADVMATVGAVSALAPTLIMTYWNPIERYGVENFVSDLVAHGGSGVITPDLTVEESAPWIGSTLRHGANRVFVVALSTGPDRLKRVADASSGFIYAASLMGVTGTRTSVSVGAKELVARLREVTDKPVAVGLGVSTPEQAREVAQYADGVIVGSAFIKVVQESPSLEIAVERVRELARALKAAISQEEVNL
jgi:tryptophan synthase alpha chain